MANIKSAAKRAQVAEARAHRNAAIKSSVKTAVKKVVSAITGGDAAAAQHLNKAASLLDKAAGQGVIHKNTAARKKARLAKKIAARG